MTVCNLHVIDTNLFNVEPYTVFSYMLYFIYYDKIIMINYEFPSLLRPALFWDVTLHRGGHSLPNFRDSLSVAFSRVKKSKKRAVPGRWDR
jgi:hypothetical protein